MICGDKQRLKTSRVFLIDRFAQGHSRSSYIVFRRGSAEKEPLRRSPGAVNSRAPSHFWCSSKDSSNFEEGAT
eukprot:4585576-Prymnesium_polylepis.1